MSLWSVHHVDGGPPRAKMRIRGEAHGTSNAARNHGESCFVSKLDFRGEKKGRIQRAGGQSYLLLPPRVIDISFCSLSQRQKNKAAGYIFSWNVSNKEVEFSVGFPSNFCEKSDASGEDQ
ncbi:hypothetical protein ACLOJK_021742 [Asimina triloba]